MVHRHRFIFSAVLVGLVASLWFRAALPAAVLQDPPFAHTVVATHAHYLLPDEGDEEDIALSEDEDEGDVPELHADA